MTAESDSRSSRDRLLSQIETLKESARLDWVSVAEGILTREEREEVRVHINNCNDELNNARRRLDELDAKGT